ncbi:MAG: hypothetical protein FD167_2960, partial [bacterium]
QADAQINRSAALRILNDGSFDPNELSKLDDGVFRVTIRRPWNLNQELRRSPSRTNLSREEETAVADRALGNALRAVREQAGCSVNNISRLDTPVGLYPQFGTFTVTTRC